MRSPSYARMMALLGDPVLWSKLRPPETHGHVVVRERLHQRLQQSAARVWSFDGPAGYGKTSLMVAEVARSPEPFAWLTLDHRDNDGGRLWTHLAAALDEIGVDTDVALPRLEAGDIAGGVDEMLAALERHGQPVIIVFDDVHELESGSAMDQLDRFVRLVDPGVRMALLARGRSELAIIRLVATGEAIVVGADELAFTEDEARAVLYGSSDDRAPLNLDPATVMSVMDRVEGWPAGIRLARLAMQRGHDLADIELALTDQSLELPRYLTDEIVTRQPDSVRAFLVETSILDDLTPGACDAVTESIGALGVLRSLASDGVLTSLVDATSSTYRYHGLLRAHLRSMLDERSLAERDALHARATRWYLRVGDLDAAVRHAVAGHDTATVLQIMSDHYIDAANAGQIDRMWRWVALVGAEHVLRHPILAPMPAWASLNQRRYDEIEPWLESIEMVDENHDVAVDFAIHAATVRCHLARHEGRLDDALRHGAEATALVDQSPGHPIESSAIAAHGVALAISGDPTASDVFRRAIEASHVSGEGSSLVLSYAYLGFVDTDSDAAEALADSALALVSNEELERFHQPAAAWFVRARAAFDQGRVGDAEASLDRAARIAADSIEPLLTALIEALRGRVHHMHGRDEQRRSALRAADRALVGASGHQWIADIVRRAHAETRFAPADDAHLPPGARELSEREMSVLRLLPYGMARRELAAQLFVSENTIKTHLTSIRRKLGVSGRADVVATARTLGLLVDEAADASDPPHRG